MNQYMLSWLLDYTKRMDYKMYYKHKYQAHAILLHISWYSNKQDCLYIVENRDI